MFKMALIDRLFFQKTWREKNCSYFQEY